MGNTTGMISRIFIPTATVALILGIGGLAGCAKGPEFQDRTARLTLGTDTESYTLDSCGLMGETIFVVGRSDAGAIIQLVMGMEDDAKTAVLASSGFTVDLDPTGDDSRLSAFGQEAWERRSSSGRAPGEITSARLRGSRIQMSGNAVPLDGQDRIEVGGEPQQFSFDGRCDEREQGN